ncbi:S66 peptidase family protein [Lacipirellula sp.]|uniref:S66 peptidase family protein n=1 Tax=Lacipirellula sp. TaxID=2691419 RepID=UPI003D132A6D
MIHRVKTQLVLSMAVVVTAVSAVCSAAEPQKLVWPKRLAPGDTIALIAPAGPPDREQVMRFKNHVEQRGYKVKLREDMFNVEGYLAGSDKRRAEEFNEAFADPEVDGVLAVRGGYGCMRMMPLIDWDVVKKNPKLLLGYSDITALHAGMNKVGIVSFHGPGPASGLGSEKGPTEFTGKYVLHAVEATPESPAGPYTVEVPKDVSEVDSFGKGKATGRLVGGNLSLISALEGTPYAIDTDGAILVIEDVNEAPYRIDRMIQQLKLAGKLDHIKGAVLGKFTEDFVREDKLTDDQRFDTTGVLRQYFEDLGVPVLVNFPIGHYPQNCTVPLGGEVEVDADAKTLKILAP